MKNSYLFLSLCIGVLSSTTIAQDAYVTGNQKVKVNPNTLVYFGGNLTLNNAVTAEKVVENAGNIKVNGNFANAGDATGKNFISTWTAENNYGQVIINQASTVQHLAMEKGKISPASFEWGQFSIPYSFATANDAMNALFGTNYVQSSRYYSSMMTWDNTDKPEFDHLLSATPMSPGDYVILNLKYYSGGIRGLMENTSSNKLVYPGLPTNGEFSKAIKTSIYPAGDWNEWKELKNNHNERYRTYIDDKIRQNGTADVNYGKYHYQFGNPYTSNINLAYIGRADGYDDGNHITNLAGVARLSKVVWTPLSGNVTSESNMFIAKYDNTNHMWSGSADALIVKPFEPFIIILDDAAAGDSRVINFSDKLKTFAMAPGVVVNPAAPVAPRLGDDNAMETAEGDVAEDRVHNNNSMAASFSTKKYFYQAELMLYNQADEFTGNKAFVVATNMAKNGVPNKLESEYSDFANRTGFYLAQERANGTVVEESDRKMHINTIALNYTNKPIPFFFNRKAGDNETYVVKANLYFHDIFSKLTESDFNFQDGNSFFFHDSVEDVLLPITTDFSYNIQASGENLTNRYQVYWNAVPTADKELITEELIAESTIIYKDKATHKVRFNPEWTLANTLKVYDLSGRKIMEYFNVKTDADFEIKLPTNGIYVVKIESNTGDVYTQKIVK